MDDFNGYVYSWSGFTDYSKCYHDVSVLTIIIQVCVVTGCIISSIPQLSKVVEKRTSFGLSGLFAALTSFGHLLVIMNYICLHNSDFVGLLQISPAKAWKRFLTFLHFFTLWILFYPIIPLYIQFFDKAKRRNTGHPGSNRADYITNVVYLMLYLLMVILLFSLFTGLSERFGFGSAVTLNTGKVLGTASSVLSLIHYLPQFYTTCKIKGMGSLSLIMLCIQAPGGIISAVTMALGQNEHWTTFMCILCSAIQQLILLIVCLYYEYCYKKTNIERPLLGSSSANGYVQTDSL